MQAKPTILASAVSALCLAIGLAGCDSNSGPVDVPNKGRVERKEFDKMSVEEKVKFIENTPMPPEAKAKEIARIKSGQL
ncbi:MAG: hypothetical protein SFX74_05985 [Fimbriimonadaceae bacterium]|nr:hypothetical protein [Fimbriimonadaceae bacterium]